MTDEKPVDQICGMPLPDRAQGERRRKNIKPKAENLYIVDSSFLFFQ